MDSNKFQAFDRRGRFKGNYQSRSPIRLSLQDLNQNRDILEENSSLLADIGDLSSLALIRSLIDGRDSLYDVHRTTQENDVIKSHSIRSDFQERRDVLSCENDNSPTVYSLDMIKSQGLNESGGSNVQLNYKPNFYSSDGFSCGSQSSYDDWPPFSKSRSTFVSNLSDRGSSNASSYMHSNTMVDYEGLNSNLSRGSSISDKEAPISNDHQLCPKSCLLDLSLLLNSKNNDVNYVEDEILSFGSRVPDFEVERNVLSIIDSSILALNNENCIYKQNARPLSQSEMHHCLLHVVRSLLSESQDFNIIHVYQRIFGVFNMDFSTLDLPSVGSFLHNDGFCKPCVFANKRVKNCNNGSMCFFCHHHHKDIRQRSRKPKDQLQLGDKDDNVLTTFKSNPKISEIDSLDNTYCDKETD